MQFADFISCAWDHLVTVAAKQFFRGRTPVPIVVRLPSGGGRGPFHSQNPESRASRASRSCAPRHHDDAKGLLATSIEDPNPVLYFEHKHLYRRIKGEVPEERYTIPFGQARVHREGDDAVVVVGRHGAHGLRRGRPACGRGIRDRDPRPANAGPWDKARVLESVKRCSKVLVLHEDTRTGGFGGEIAATIAEEAFEDLDAPVMRIAAPDTPVPFSPALEKAFLPRSRTSPRPCELAQVRRPKSAIADFGQGTPEGVRFAARRSDSCRRPRRRIVDRNQIEVVMPQMGVSVSEGTITKWLKQPGEPVARDEPLLEISTDKVDTEVPSPGEGVLAEIIVPEGQTVEVGTVPRIGPAGSEPAAPVHGPRGARARAARSRA